MSKGVVCIDFDGTICTGDISRPEDLRAGVLEAMKELKRKGYRILIHSCRIHPLMSRKYAAEMLEFLKVKGVPYDEVWCGRGKPIADWYVDDKAIFYRGNWEEVMETMRRFEQ